jgi:hypothetical protein
MEDALELEIYLPASFANSREQAYLDFLWSAFRTNYEAERYEFASLAFHLIYMSFVSFSIWQIKIARPDEFSMAMVGFKRDDETDLLKCDNPFKFYEKLRESQIFRFLKIIGCSNEQIGEFGKFVRRRNKIAHPTGNIFFNDRVSIDAEIADMMKEVRNIEEHMKPVILDLYLRFLNERDDEEDWQYTLASDEVTANFVHTNYMSVADLAFCHEFDVDSLEIENGFLLKKALHEALLTIYPTPIHDG